MVPIAGTTTYLDLAIRLRLPLLLVAANRLGTVNHCALTARVAEAARITVHGFVLSQTTATTDASGASNAETIVGLTALRCLGVLPHLVRPEEAAPLLVLPPV